MNRGMRVLQTLALPLGYVTVSAKNIILYGGGFCQERIRIFFRRYLPGRTKRPARTGEINPTIPRWNRKCKRKFRNWDDFSEILHIARKNGANIHVLPH